MRALDGPTSRPGRCHSRRAGAPGWPWLRDPRLGGRVINSRHRRPPAPRPPHCQLQPTPDPGPGRARPLGPGSCPREEGAGRAARGRGEAAPPETSLDGGGGGGGVGCRMVIGMSETSQPGDLPEPSFSTPFPYEDLGCGEQERRVSLQPQGSTFPTWPAGERGQSLGGGGRTRRDPAPLPIWERRRQLGTLRSPPVQGGGARPHSCCEGLGAEG